MVDRGALTLSHTEFKLVTYLYRIADATPDRKVSQSIQEIAQAAGLACRTVQENLQDLATRGVIDVLSDVKERTLIQIPQQR